MRDSLNALANSVTPAPARRNCTFSCKHTQMNRWEHENVSVNGMLRWEWGGRGLESERGIEVTGFYFISSEEGFS